MITCNNPKFKGKCVKKDSEICCRHCSEVNICIEELQEFGCICGYVSVEEDLKNECPFELR
jgi:hypothetical protein